MQERKPRLLDVSLLVSWADHDHHVSELLRPQLLHDDLTWSTTKLQKHAAHPWYLFFFAPMCCSRGIPCTANRLHSRVPACFLSQLSPCWSIELQWRRLVQLWPP